MSQPTRQPLKPAYLILGDDLPKIESALKRLKSRIVEEAGSDINVEEFDAEITMWWGEEAEKIVMDGTSVAHVPPGLLHRGLFFDPVRRPYVHIHAYTAPTHGKAEIVDEHVKGAGVAAAPEAASTTGT